jgi:hypothetical protein
MGTDALGRLREHLEKGLGYRNLLAKADDQSAKTLKIEVTEFRIRAHPGAGVLGGYDRINSFVQIVDPAKDSAVVGEYVVETKTAAEHAGATVLIERHVDEILAAMR